MNLAPFFDDLFLHYYKSRRIHQLTKSDVKCLEICCFPVYRWPNIKKVNRSLGNCSEFYAVSNLKVRKVHEAFFNPLTQNTPK